MVIYHLLHNTHQIPPLKFSSSSSSTLSAHLLSYFISSSQYCRARSFFDSEEYRAEQEASTKMQDISAELNNLPPLNLTLRKTPSFLNLIKTKLSTRSGSGVTGPSASQLSPEKLKASNFPISFIRIGSWQEVSQNEADLVAKCYFSKKKLVWEVLRNGLKSKIEIQWSEIAAIRATMREDQPGILELELDQVPAFYQESNPQPRKHTIWHLTTDFTEGQASMHRRHYVRFPPGTLDRHLEKLLQCDRRLLELTKKGFPSLDSPYFNWSPYEYNTCYYSFNGGGDHTSMEVKPQVQFPAAAPPQWAIQPPLLVEEYSTTSPMSAGSRETTTMEFTHNDHDTNYGFGDTRVDFWDQGSNPSFYGEASRNHHRDGYSSLQCPDDNIGFGLLAEQSSQHTPMGFSSGMDNYSMLSYQPGYVDSIITSCTSGLVDAANEGITGANGFIYPPFTEEFGLEDPSRMKMNWY